jgi:hypothetical protein
MARIVTAKMPKPLKGLLGLKREKPPADDPEAERRAEEWIRAQLEKYQEAYQWGLTRPKG